MVLLLLWRGNSHTIILRELDLSLLLLVRRIWRWLTRRWIKRCRDRTWNIISRRLEMMLLLRLLERLA
jgi:hypothetical protein